MCCRAARRKPTCCRRVVFIWAIRDASECRGCLLVRWHILTHSINAGQVQWISGALFQVNALTPAWLTVSIKIFVTRDWTPDNKESNGWSVLPSVCIEYGRPDLKSILRGEVETATGSMVVSGAFVTSGLSVQPNYERE